MFLGCAALVVFLPGTGVWVYPLLFNLVLLGGIAGLLFFGYANGQEFYINLGLLFFSIECSQVF